MTMRYLTWAFILGVVYYPAATSAALAPPILEYRLNSADNLTSLPAGSVVSNSGSSGALGDLTMNSEGAPGSSANFYSVDGGGVSGLAGDRAYDNTISTAMGKLGTPYAAPNRGPRASNDADNGILNGTTALTITGWVKTEAGKTWDGLAQVWAGDAGFFMNLRSSEAVGAGAGKIEFEFRTGTNTASALARSSTANWNLDNQWMFVGVTWDGTSGDIGMYYVDEFNQVQSTTTSYANALALRTGAIQDTSQTAGSPAATYGLTIGNQGGYALRPFDGLLDNFRVFDVALTQADLQTVVNKDLLNQALGTPGDFDADGDVDGADFIAWQTNYPTTGTATQAQGDADGDGDVDGADFAAWQGSFPLSPSSGVTPVPEPTALFLVFAAGSVAFCRRIRLLVCMN